MKVFRKKNYLQIEFADGSNYSTTTCSDDLFSYIESHIEDEEALQKELLGSEYFNGKELSERIANSKILTLRGNSVYMLDISELSIPEDFVQKILEAEENNDEKEIAKFKNFWTLVSLNPDSRVRNNLFWFIRKWNMQITESGLIIAYRNADIKTEAKYSTNEVKDIINRYYQIKYLEHNNPSNIIIRETLQEPLSLEQAYNEIVNGADSPVYTDYHSHTTEIRLGHPVSIPREECDANQENSCSSGLHCGAKGWLKKNYYGNIGLMVLVNPANVVAVPTIDEYGKMRTCEYFPVAIIDYNKSGDIIDNGYNLYSDINYLQKLKYEGEINNKDIDVYTLSSVVRSREELYDNILKRLDQMNT